MLKLKDFRWKQILHLAGLGMGIAGVVFVVMRLSVYFDQIDFSVLSGFSRFCIIGLALAYSLANIFQALAWRDLLRYAGITTTKQWAVQTYGISQIAKYIPGNIFQFAGRQAIGQTEGLPALPLAKSAFWEIVLLASSGASFFVLILPLFWPHFPAQISLLAFIFIIVTACIIAQRWLGPAIVSAIKNEIFFLILAGIVFTCVVLILIPSRPGQHSFFILVTGVYVVAWLAGLITPGAPAGIGVREMVFLALLHPFFGERELLEAIVVGRLVTISGDVFYYLFSFFTRLHKRASETPFLNRSCDEIE